MTQKILRHLLTTVLCISCICLTSQTVQAMEYTDSHNDSTYTTEYPSLNTPYFTVKDFDVNKKRDFTLKKGKSKITWTEGYY